MDGTTGNPDNVEEESPYKVISFPGYTNCKEDECYSSHETEDVYGNQNVVSTANVVTPCHNDVERQRRNNTVELHQSHGLESDLSWVKSFCSVESHNMAEFDSISLSPPVHLKSIYPSNQQNFPSLLRSASWASSDVGSELTDNSHMKEL